MTALLEVYNKWQSDLKFRESYKKNPEKALEEEGFHLSPEDLAKIRAMVKFDKSKNEKLEDRISK